MVGRDESGVSHHVAHDATFGGGDGSDTQWSKHTVLPNTDFDELVVGSWIHIEQMDTGRWWMNIGGVTVWVTADRDGKPTSVTVFGPKDYDAPVDGCRYEYAWTEAK